MATSANQGEVGRFSLSRALSDSGRALQRRWWLLLTLAVMLSWGPSALVRLNAWTLEATRPMGAPKGAAVLAWLYFVIAATLYRTLVTATVLQALAARQPGKSWLAGALRAVPILLPVVLMENASSLLRPLLFERAPLHTIALVQVAAGLVETLLFPIIGLITPVGVAERVNPVSVVIRSFRIMAGSRWPLIGLSLLVSVGKTVLTLASLPLIRRMTASHSLVSGADLIGWENRLLSLLWITFLAAAYLELRRAKDGLTQGDVAAVFD